MPDKVSMDPHAVKATPVVGSVQPPKVVHREEPTKLYPENWYHLIVDEDEAKVSSDKGWFVLFLA